MKILQLFKLNTKQIKDVESLVQECLKVDGLKRTIYLDSDINYYVNLRSFFLLYNEERLVSVLTIYAPTYEEAEISAYTLPDERKKGYFKTLLNKAWIELQRFDIKRVLFVIEPESKSGLACVKALNAKYSRSEYLLSYIFQKSDEVQGDNLADIESHENIIIKELTKDHMNEAVKLGSLIFQVDEEETLDVIQLSMTTSYMKCYGAFYNKELCGICNISFGAQYASIFGFGISPKLQGKGYGRRVLRQLLRLIELKNYSTVTLHVGSENKHAFDLYISEGFKIHTQYDYYEYKLNN